MSMGKEHDKARAALRFRTLITVLVAAGICLLSSRLITGRPVFKDAAATLLMAINLQHHGVISLADSPPYVASMVREPVPILTEAGGIWLIDALRGPAQASNYLSGDRAALLKLENLLWLALLMMSAAAAVRYFDCGTGWELAAVALVALPFTLLIAKPARSIIGVDCLTTELPGAALLLMGSLAWARGFVKLNAGQLCLASAIFGLLALTKAAVFYVYLVAVGILVLVTVLRARRRLLPYRRVVWACCALLAPFLLLTGSWMYRNYHQLGSFQITERDGPIVLYRGMLTGMTRTEYLGSFYAWSSWPIQHTVGRLTGFSQADLGGDGRLRHLPLILSGSASIRDQQAEDADRPQDTITWYRRSRAIYESEVRQLAGAGVRDPEASADAATRLQGLRLIVRHPFMELALLLPMLWAGATLTFPLLILALVWAWHTRRLDLAIYALPALGIVLFYAAFTEFDMRYGWLPRPISTVTLVVTLAGLLKERYRLAAHYHQSPGNASATAL